MTKLDKPVRREVDIEGDAYTLTIDPQGMRLALKGHQNGFTCEWKDLVNDDAAVAAALQASI
ncbi:MAG TPA: hypothetical protein VFG67_07735 [Oleiagrimonas sp.]|nr:hypothetical protein [Oleiagrimonas sp.]